MATTGLWDSELCIADDKIMYSQTLIDNLRIETQIC